jgi:hypothetical protein
VSLSESTREVQQVLACNAVRADIQQPKAIPARTRGYHCSCQWRRAQISSALPAATQRTALPGLSPRQQAPSAVSPPSNLSHASRLPLQQLSVAGRHKMDLRCSAARQPFTAAPLDLCLSRSPCWCPSLRCGGRLRRASRQAQRDKYASGGYVSDSVCVIKLHV